MIYKRYHCKACGAKRMEYNLKQNSYGEYFCDPSKVNCNKKVYTNDRWNQKTKYAVDHKMAKNRFLDI